VTPMTGGPAVAFGVCEALRAKQGLLGGARTTPTTRSTFASSWTRNPAEPVVLVDDILRTGSKLSELRKLLESRGAMVVGLAVVNLPAAPRLRRFSATCRLLPGRN